MKKDRSVRYNGKNLQKLLRGTRRLNGKSVSVGFFSDVQHVGASEKAGKAVSVGEVAAWMNEGLNPYAPQRPFFDIASTLARRELKNLAQRLTRRLAAGNITYREYLQQMGDLQADYIQEVMENSSSYGIEPNSDSWAAVKGNSGATIYTGELLSKLEVRINE